jgi:hypothetical protein
MLQPVCADITCCQGVSAVQVLCTCFAIVTYETSHIHFHPVLYDMCRTCQYALLSCAEFTVVDQPDRSQQGTRACQL